MTIKITIITGITNENTNKNKIKIKNKNKLN